MERGVWARNSEGDAVSDLRFDPAEHAYYLGDRRLPSVTQVIPREQSYPAGAAERGTAVHLACEYDDLGDLDEGSVAPEIAGYLEAYRKWKRESMAQIESIELREYNEAYLYAGTIDRVVVFPYRGRAVIDIKSGVPEKWHALQTAAYANLLTYHMLSRFSLYLAEDGTYKIIEHYREDFSRDFSVFIGLLSYHNWRNK